MLDIDARRVPRRRHAGRRRSRGPTSPPPRRPTASRWSSRRASRPPGRRSRSAPTSPSSRSTPRPARCATSATSPCDDAGRVINPLILEGQIHGGVAQGAAQALLEEVRYDDDGNPITSNLADYGMISAAELPSFEIVHMETPTPLNPLGAKGIGESGTIGSTPAVQSAVVDAVAHLGVRHIDMPATPSGSGRRSAPPVDVVARTARSAADVTRRPPTCSSTSTGRSPTPSRASSRRCAGRSPLEGLAGARRRRAAHGDRTAVRARAAADRRARRPPVGRHRALPRALRGRRAVREPSCTTASWRCSTASPASGLVLALATAKPEVTARRIVEHFGLTDRFAVLAGATFEPGRRTKAEVIAHALAELERRGRPARRDGRRPRPRRPRRPGPRHRHDRRARGATASRAGADDGRRRAGWPPPRPTSSRCVGGLGAGRDDIDGRGLVAVAVALAWRRSPTPDRRPPIAAATPSDRRPTGSCGGCCACPSTRRRGRPRAPARRSRRRCWWPRSAAC